MRDLPARYARIAAALIGVLGEGGLHARARDTLRGLAAELDSARAHAESLLDELRAQADLAGRWVEEMDFSFLFDRRRKLLHIGYDAAAQRLDPSYYDLLASEARTAVFLAIAKGDIPREAWFHLGRTLTSCHGNSTLVSWSGTMFEYLMPLLFLKSYQGTLLDESARAVVRVQQEYGRRRKAPWGVSEAAYGLRDHAMAYQYQPFGLPELSSNPAISDELVIAPYASMLGAMVDRPGAHANLALMAANGWTGRYGFYESVDYTPRPGQGHPPSVIRAWMAHHQGMALIALGNTLLNGRMQERFHANPLVLATEYLLQERLPALVDATGEQQKINLEFRMPVRRLTAEEAL